MILNFIYTIQAIFDTIRKAISGHSIVKYSQEISGIVDEVYNLDIPTSKVDRRNLRDDGSAVAKDFNKAVQERKKLELHPHG